jgi:autotransporter-associated beta strand protein
LGGGNNPTFNIGNVVWGSAIFNPAEFVLNSSTTAATSSATFSSNIDLGGATRTIRSDQSPTSPASGRGTFSGIISNGGIIKTGVGQHLFSGANTYIGGTTIQQGTLQLGNASALGSTTATLTVNGGLLDINNQTVSVGNLTGSGGTIYNNGNAARTFTIGNGGGTGGNFQGVIANNTNAGAGSLALVKTAAGSIILSGNNTYTGATLISGGVLQIGNGGTTGSLATSALTNNATLIYNRSNDFSVGYVISGSGQLIKQGAGMMTLTTAAAYTGDTTISAGTLKLNQPSASNDGAFVTIADTGGATLNLNFPGTDIVEELYIGTTRMAYGVYKASDNPAPGIPIAQITGTGTLTVTGDVVAPTLLNMVDGRNGRPAPANSPISYTITFSEEMDIATVSAADFANAGTAPISIGAITQITPGVFTVLVTPTDAGTLRLEIPAGAIITDPAGNPVNTTSDILDNVTLGIYMPDGPSPNIRGISPVVNSSGSTITLPVPAGARPGDWLLASIMHSTSSGTASITNNNITNPGWTSRRKTNLAGNLSNQFVVLSRILTTADTGSFTITLNGTSPVAAGIMVAISGVDTYTGPNDTTTSISGTFASQATANAAPGPVAEVTTKTANAMVILLGMTIGTDSVSWSDWATTSPGSLTEIYDVTGGGVGSSAMSLGMAWGPKAVVGATGAGSATLSSSAINGLMLTGIMPSYNNALITALTALKAHITGAAPLTAAEIAAHKATIETYKRNLGFSPSALAAAMDLVRTYDEVLGPLWIARSLPARASVTDDIHYTIFRVMTCIMIFGYTPSNVAAHPDLFNNFAFGSSTRFPGACAPPADPEQVHTAVINANYPDSWGRLTIGESNSSNPSPKPTGTYLAPGSIATITVPASMVGKGYNVRVGAHKTDFSGKTSITRLDQCSLSYPIVSTSTKVANPLGGGIYIDVPPYISNVGVVSIQIKNAVRSPYFSAKSFHRTTLAEWQNTERNHPAPWADFQSDKVMMQVPTSWIYSLNDPVTLMADWDRSADSVNDLMGFPRIRGRETIYNQVDLMIAGIGGFTPGWPSVNNTYSPGTNYNNGYADNYLVRGPQFAPYVEFHELGHAYTFPKLTEERESDVNLLYVPVLNEGFGYSLDEAFRRSIDGRTYVTLDTTTIAWMMCDTFLNGVAMPEAEKQYAFKGHAKFVEVARLFGWKRLGNYFYSMNADYEAGRTVDMTDRDSVLQRLCTSTGIDIRPLFHFWGFPPVNSTTLGNSIQTANLPASRVIYDTLVRYKSLVPPDNATFRTFANGWWGKQPLSTGFSEERYHAARWDSYDATMATATAARAQSIIDIYFPAGRPSDYGDWRSQWATANLVNPQADLDGDGMSNDQERIWGMDPTLASSRNPVQFNSGLPSGSFSYTRRNRALTGLNYSVWTSPNLTDWTEDAGAQQTPGAPDANGNQTVNMVISPGLLANPSLFIRMRASE